MFSPGGESPMMVASPAASPGSPHTSHLPAYLLGDSSTISVSPGPRMWGISSPSPPKSSSRTFNTSAFGTPLGGRSDLLRQKERMGAPPIKSLMSSPVQDTANVSSFASPYGTPAPKAANTSRFGATNTPGAPPISGLAMENSMDMTNNTSGKIATSPAQLDPFYTHGDSVREASLDGTWVTVFGFPPSAASYILQQFSQYGNIIKHVVSPEGNWMHLHYQSKLQAKKALSKNGKILGDRIMIGVTYCIDTSVMECDQENKTRTSFSVNNKENASQNLDASLQGNNSNTPIRPLTAAYRTARNENEVVHSNQAPKKSNTFVSKAMEYMFGW